MKLQSLRLLDSANKNIGCPANLDCCKQHIFLKYKYVPKVIRTLRSRCGKDLVGLCLYSLKNKQTNKKLPYNNQSKITKEWGKKHLTNQVKVTEDKQV